MGPPCIGPKPVSWRQRRGFLSLAAKSALEIQNSSRVVSNAWKGEGVDGY